MSDLWPGRSSAFLLCLLLPYSYCRGSQQEDLENRGLLGPQHPRVSRMSSVWAELVKLRGAGEVTHCLWVILSRVPMRKGSWLHGVNFANRKKGLLRKWIGFLRRNLAGIGILHIHKMMWALVMVWRTSYHKIICTLPWTSANFETFLFTEHIYTAAGGIEE